VTAEARLAVLGSPIAHSRSPRLHAAAYAELGLDWAYGAEEVTASELAGFVAARDATWRGLSLTMPLKRDILPLLDSLDATARLTGAANTVLFDRSAGGLALRGFNTDVFGVVEAFREAGVHRLDRVQILGGGATAASVLVAVHRLGAGRVLLSLRDPARAAGLVALGEELGLVVTPAPLAPAPDGSLDGALDAVVSTIPGRAEHDLVFPRAVREHAVLFDVAYDPWPTSLARSWAEADGRVVSGLGMLLHQALAQVRVFVGGSPDAALPREARVLQAMRRAIDD
jgi:shikimate dehydrogenase